MKQLVLFFAILSIAILNSCRKDFTSIPSNGQLKFSKDTVYLDTVFTNIGSSTYRLKVYNRSDDPITIPTIQLERGEASNYRLNVDGIPGKQFDNVDILAKDSIFIFMETTIDYNDIADPLYIDKILFDAGDNEQEVTLVTLTQDAHFLYPNRENGVIETLEIDGESTNIPGRFLVDDELTFTNEKPYVIYGYMMVGDSDNNAKTLTIESGALVHFHANSGLIVNENSSLQVQGSLNVDGQPATEVVFEGDRLEPDYADVPGQWGLIWLRAGSLNHQINYTTIKNSSIGILIDGFTDINTPILEIRNSQIYNSAQYGILARQTNILGENLVINKASYSSLAASQGGVYNFTHCTFANYWSGQRSYPTVLLNNFYAVDENTLVAVDLVDANFTNCIIAGNNNLELTLNRIDGASFNYSFINNLLQFDDIQDTFVDNPLYDFTDTNHFINTILNENFHFKDTSLNELIIGEESAGNGQAATSGTTQTPLDILGKTRASPADIGAYEHIVFE